MSVVVGTTHMTLTWKIGSVRMYVHVYIYLHYLTFVVSSHPIPNFSVATHIGSSLGHPFFLLPLPLDEPDCGTLGDGNSFFILCVYLHHLTLILARLLRPQR